MVYIDLLLVVNFVIDFLVLLSVKKILRRNVKIVKLIFAATFGELSLILLFINLNNFILLLIKFVFGIFIILICFGYRSLNYFKDNLLYFYLGNILLGGGIYFLNLNIEAHSRNFFALNSIISLIFSPIIIYLYSKKILKLKNFYSYFYKVELFSSGQRIELNAYLDTGNNLKDPYKNRNIIIVNNEKIKTIKKKILLVPINTVSGFELLKCFKVDNIFINGVGYRNNLLIGISPKNINIDGIDCLLNKNILEEAWN